MTRNARSTAGSSPNRSISPSCSNTRIPTTCSGRWWEFSATLKMSNDHVPMSLSRPASCTSSSGSSIGVADSSGSRDSRRCVPTDDTTLLCRPDPRACPSSAFKYARTSLSDPTLSEILVLNRSPRAISASAIDSVAVSLGSSLCFSRRPCSADTTRMIGPSRSCALRITSISRTCFCSARLRRCSRRRSRNSARRLRSLASVKYIRIRYPAPMHSIALRRYPGSSSDENSFDNRNGVWISIATVWNDAACTNVKIQGAAPSISARTTIT